MKFRSVQIYKNTETMKFRIFNQSPRDLGIGGSIVSCTKSRLLFHFIHHFVEKQKKKELAEAHRQNSSAKMQDKYGRNVVVLKLKKKCLQ